MAMFLLIIILCDVLINSDVLFYLRSDGQHILFGDALMAVFFLLIIILCDVLINSGGSFLLIVRWPIYFS